MQWYPVIKIQVCGAHLFVFLSKVTVILSDTKYIRRTTFYKILYFKKYSFCIIFFVTYIFFLEYTDMNMTQIMQRLSVHYSGNFGVLRYFITQVAGLLENIESDKRMRAFGAIDINFENKVVILEVSSSFAFCSEYYWYSTVYFSVGCKSGERHVRWCDCERHSASWFAGHSD